MLEREGGGGYLFLERKVVDGYLLGEGKVVIAIYECMVALRTEVGW